MIETLDSEKRRREIEGAVSAGRIQERKESLARAGDQAAGQNERRAKIVEIE